MSRNLRHCTAVALIVHSPSQMVVETGQPQQLSRNIINCADGNQAERLAEAMASVPGVQAIPCKRVFDVFGKACYVRPSDQD